ncbi:MAG: hypothetical protein M0Z28_17670 [Rhodospirillales bacterium]|nr:hypothetical protein [Rhodospirillales bacterium]
MKAPPAAVVRAGWLIAGGLLWAPPTMARVLAVGPGLPFPLPSAAAAAARNGDQVTIAPDTYFDCAEWRASDLVISATAPGVTITDKACGGKASFVISGDRVTVRGISFDRVRVPDGNGAGIRAEGRDLTVEDCTFVNDQDGILSGRQGGFLRISNSRFIANGISLDGRPTHAVTVGALDLLRIEHSSFAKGRGGDDIDSSARRTEIVADSFADEGGHMAGPLVMVRGGALTLDGNRFDLAPAAADRPGAVLFVGDATALAVRGNTLVEPQGHVPLLRNWTGLSATAQANTAPPNAVVVSDSGTTYHRLRAQLAALRDELRGLAHTLRHIVGSAARAAHLIR